MPRFFLFILVQLLLIAAPLPGGRATAADLVLKEIRFTRPNRQTEQVDFSLTTFTRPKIFGIEGEIPRVVCDFSRARLGKDVKQHMAVNGKIIKEIRIGIHLEPDPKIRVVLDLIPGPDYDIQQTYLIDRSCYSVTIRRNNHGITLPGGFGTDHPVVLDPPSP
ncbi:MAG: AMIN domain-containing protein [Desulfobacterales bacterium]|nr:AMIN domain-containing protein [Desulfobacterales bacterium]